MKAALGIRGITAECGQRAHGFVTIGETASGPIQFPVVIANGVEDGPVLCLTAEATSEERDEVLRAGAVGLLEKGGSIEALAEAIHGAAPPTAAQ